MDVKYAIHIILSAVVGLLFGTTLAKFFLGEAHIMHVIIVTVMFAAWLQYHISDIRKFHKEIKSLEEIMAGLEQLNDVLSDIKLGKEEFKSAKTKKERIEAMKRDLEKLASHVSNTKNSKLRDDVHALQRLVNLMLKHPEKVE